MAAEIPETMRAAQLKQYGLEKDNFVVNSIPVPEIKANEVLIEVHAAAPNPVDYKMARGMSLLFVFASPVMRFKATGVVAHD
jgi:NADPH:quinone reductase-like Zn-dependent oxidoreductase